MCVELSVSSKKFISISFFETHYMYSYRCLSIYTSQFCLSRARASLPRYIYIFRYSASSERSFSKSLTTDRKIVYARPRASEPLSAAAAAAVGDDDAVCSEKSRPRKMENHAPRDTSIFRAADAAGVASCVFLESFSFTLCVVTAELSLARGSV